MSISGTSPPKCFLSIGPPEDDHDVKFRPALLCLLIASLATSAAFGQANTLVPPKSASNSPNTTVLPLWNNQNGQVDALLLIEPSVLPQLPSERIIGSSAASRGLQLRAGLSLEANPGMVVEAEGHGFFNPANVAELYRRMETFLDKNLPVGAPAAGAGH